MSSALQLRSFAFLLFSVSSLSLAAQKQGSASNPYVLNPSPATVAWGYYWSEAAPVLRIHSEDYVRVRTVLTSNPERLEGAGVPADQVEKELRDVQAVKGKGAGGGVLWGPIYIEEAEPGGGLGVGDDLMRVAMPYWDNGIVQAAV